MERHISTLGIVINKKTSKEADLVITLLTPKIGKIIALAKGAKSIKSSRLGNLQLGNIIKVQLYQKNNFFWISETQNIDSFLQTNKNLAQLNLLFYFLEIVNQFVAENQQIEKIFDISKNIITAINKNYIQQYIQNEIYFLEILGFGVPTDIKENFNKKDYKTCQKLIKRFFESIIEKPLESNKLFK
jgi:DNA repair protein RecO (recombination protein O)